MTKKIIFCVTNDLSTDQRMIRICTSLATHDYEVELVGRRLSDSKVLEEKCFAQKRLYCYFRKGKLFYIEYNIRLFFYLLLQKTDAICAIDLDTILPVFVVTKWRSKVCIYDAHEYFTEVPEVINRPLVKRVWEKIAAFTIPKIKYSYTVSESLQKVFSARYHTDFQLIRNISSRHAYAKKSNFALSEKKVIWYQGALNEGRGLEHMIAAMPYLKEYEFWLAGEGDLSHFLRQLVLEKGLEEHIKFLGKVSPSELGKLAPQFILGINIVENKGLSYYYSLANRTFDFIQAELPAIHSNFPEYQAIIAKYAIGETLISFEPEKLAAQIRGIVENQSKYEAMKLVCQLAKAEFCWENEEIKLLKFYKRVFNQL